MEPNLNQIEEIVAGDEMLKNRLIGIVKKELPVEMSDLKVHIQNKDFLLASKLVHKIKHKINLFGMHTSYELAVNFENELKNEKISLFDDFLLILEKIDRFLKTL